MPKTDKNLIFYTIYEYLELKFGALMYFHVLFPLVQADVAYLVRLSLLEAFIIENLAKNVLKM